MNWTLNNIPLLFITGSTDKPELYEVSDNPNKNETHVAEASSPLYLHL